MSTIVSHVLSLLLISSSVLTLRSIRSTEGDSNDSSGVRRWGRREFCCNFPWNTSMNDVFMECGVINGTKGETYAFPLRHEEPIPDFRFSVMCDAVGEEDVMAPASDCSCSGDREDDLLHCLENAEGHECKAHCVYNKLGAINSNNEPVLEKIQEITFQALNQDPSFEEAVNRAINSCFCRREKITEKYGHDSMEPCASLDILSYCIDYEIAKFCPEDARKDFNEDEECD